MMAGNIIVYTYRSNPFRFGGPQRDIIGASISEYTRMTIGKGYWGILFYNPYRNVWHIAEERSGALIGTDSGRAALIDRIRGDVETGDKAIMEQQIEEGIKERKGVDILPNEDFFKAFSGGEE